MRSLPLLVRLLLLLLPIAAWMGWWIVSNPLPDGYQNEYLLMGNAYDLWDALIAHDQWHLRWYAYTSYWPFGLFVVPWPFMAILGPTREALLLGNLVHLSVLLWACLELGRRLSAPLAPALVLLVPGVFGSLVRFEPNLAAIAWTAAGLAFLVRSDALQGRGAVLGWGISLGVGLMMDRLTVAFFLLPAILPYAVAALRREGARAVGTLALGGGAALLLTVAWYREFFLRHTEELLSQAPVGEIDAGGQLTQATDGALALAYYPLALVDSQAGPVIGVLMIVALLWSTGKVLRRPRLDDPRVPLLVATWVGLIFFTVVAKKQVFYTLPLLAPLAVLAARRFPRLSWVGVAAGVYALLSTGSGLLPGGGPWLPEPWVSPRHVLARPPSGQVLPLRQAMTALGETGVPAHVGVLSGDSAIFEGFLLLEVREAWPQAQARGVVLDPVGTYEQIDVIDRFLWVAAPGAAWPAAADVRAELLADHYDLDVLPPVDDVVAEARGGFDEVWRRTVEGGDGPVDLVVFSR